MSTIDVLAYKESAFPPSPLDVHVYDLTEHETTEALLAVGLRSNFHDVAHFAAQCLLKVQEHFEFDEKALASVELKLVTELPSWMTAYDNSTSFPSYASDIPTPLSLKWVGLMSNVFISTDTCSVSEADQRYYFSYWYTTG